jgi:hypothetical protein
MSWCSLRDVGSIGVLTVFRAYTDSRHGHPSAKVAKSCALVKERAVISIIAPGKKRTTNGRIPEH